MTQHDKTSRSTDAAKATLSTEIDGMNAVKSALGGVLGEEFAKAVDCLVQISGHVVVTGMGKSGHIGSKIAATLASTGTSAHFVHPAEASHGDLGMIRTEDAILAFSWSGETKELASILAYSRRFKVPLVAITSGPESSLAKAADIVLLLPKVEEACPHGLAPTTSTIIQMALGDALAIALLEARGFTAQDFRTFHPGGKLGANLTLVRDIMHQDDEIPLVSEDEKMGDVIVKITSRGFGCAGVTNQNGHLVGIITDGDLRRNLEDNLLQQSAGRVMTADPQSVAPDTLVASALERVSSRKITALFVVDDDKPVGIIHMHDLLRIGAA